MKEYLTRSTLAKALGVNQMLVYRHAEKPGSPKPDHYSFSRTGKLAPEWAPERLDEWRVYLGDRKPQTRHVHGSQCRCPEPTCGPRHAQWMREKYAENRANRVKAKDGSWFHPDAPHGEPSGYKYYGCECSPCTDAFRLSRYRNASYNARKKARAEEVTKHEEQQALRSVQYGRDPRVHHVRCGRTRGLTESPVQPRRDRR